MIINTIKKNKKKEKTNLRFETCRVSSPLLLLLLPSLLILVAPFIVWLHWPLAAVLCVVLCVMVVYCSMCHGGVSFNVSWWCVVQCVMVVCRSMCRGGGCCCHWVMPWWFYRHVVPVYVVNCKNIINNAKRKTYLSLELSGGRWWWEWWHGNVGGHRVVVLVVVVHWVAILLSLWFL